MKRLLFASMFTVAITMCAVAKPVEYSDKCIKFEYDDDEYQEIELNTISSSAYYQFNTHIFNNDVYPAVRFNVKIESNAEDNFLDTIFDVTSQPEEYEEEIISETERVFHGKEKTVYAKILSTYENQYAFAAIFTSSEEDPCFLYCKQIYDSLTASDQFVQNGIEYDEDKDQIGLSSKTIYRNVLYSEELQDYVQQVIYICENYLKGDLTAFDAESKCKSLSDAVQERFESSDYTYDVLTAYIFPDIYFGFVNPEAYIIEAKQELQVILEEIKNQYE